MFTIRLFSVSSAVQESEDTMSRKRFTKEEIDLLSSNPHVESVTEKYIFYKSEFKELCLSNVARGLKSLRQTFVDCGFDIGMIGWNRIKCAYGNWRKAANEGREIQTKHPHTGGRPKTKGISAEELIARKDREIKRLKEENEFLRQLRRLEGRYQPKKSPSKQDSNS